MLVVGVGQRWRDMRSTLSPVFTSSKMKTMFMLVSECSEQLIDFLERSYQQPQEGGYKIEKGKCGSTFIINSKYFKFSLKKCYSDRQTV
jgi:hypothetical protein